jgi:LacI family transcriptional regulator
VLIQSSANPFHAALREAHGAASRVCHPQLAVPYSYFEPDDAPGIAAKIREAGSRCDGLIFTSPNDRLIAAAAREVARRLPVITLATDLLEGGRWEGTG